MTPEPLMRTLSLLVCALGVLAFDDTLRFFGVRVNSESADS
jgi:hypothetical protein